MALFLCVCFYLSPYVAMAATADPSQPIDKNRECTLTLSYTYDGTAFENVSVKLYKIADVSNGFQFTPTNTFAPIAPILNGIKTDAEWNTIRATLESHIVADNMTADKIEKTAANGQVCFTALEVGLYLAIAGTVTQGEETYFFDSALVALPGIDADSILQYQVTVASKSAYIPPSIGDLEYTVVKLWKGDEGKNNRPKNIEVEIFCDGTSYEKITLSQENNWSYSFTAKANGEKWTVIERNTPHGYTMTVEERGNTFLLTNTYTLSDGPADIPQTGDTSNMILYVILMTLSGCMLIVLGIMGKRNADEKTK